MSICTIDDCDREVFYTSYGLCKKHYCIMWRERKELEKITDPDAMRTCKWCGETKPLHANFHTSNNTKGGYIWRCKECEANRRKAKRAAMGPEDVTYRIKIYGIDKEQYRAMYKAQDGVCAICKGKSENNRRLAVDHDHATGVVRALLCNRCNRVLGSMQDDAELLRRAATYLDSHKE